MATRQLSYNNRKVKNIIFCEAISIVIVALTRFVTERSRKDVTVEVSSVGKVLIATERQFQST